MYAVPATSRASPTVPPGQLSGPSAGGGEVWEQPGQSPCVRMGRLLVLERSRHMSFKLLPASARRHQAASSAKFILNQTGLLVGLFAEIT